MGDRLTVDNRHVHELHRFMPGMYALVDTKYPQKNFNSVSVITYKLADFCSVVIVDKKRKLDKNKNGYIIWQIRVSSSLYSATKLCYVSSIMYV